MLVSQVSAVAALFTLAHAQYFNSDVTNITASFIVNGTTETVAKKQYYADVDDESVVLVTNGGVLTATAIQVYQSGNSTDSGDSSFTALDAAVAVQENGTLYLHNSFIYSDGSSGNSIKVYEDGSSAYLYGVSIYTEADSAHGPYVAGGYMYCENILVVTTGAHCGAFSTDRGGGTIVVNGGNVETRGSASAIIYSTGNITTKNLVGSTQQAPCIGMDGANYAEATNPTFTCGPTDQAGILIINSFGAATAAGVVNVSGGSMNITTDDPMILTTNAISDIHLQSVTLTIASGVFLNASANQWGTSGANGGQASVYATNVKIPGNVYVDSISDAALVLLGDSYLSGSVTAETGGNATLIISSGSTWNVTAESYVTSLEDQSTCFGNIMSNGFDVYYNSTENAGYAGLTYQLNGGGYLKPYGETSSSTSRAKRAWYTNFVEKECKNRVVS